MANTSQVSETPLRMNPEGGAMFRKAVNYILTEWPSLTLAIENGMGGPQAIEKRNWISSTIADEMIKGKDIDLEDYLAEMINQEYDTLIEDGSLEYNTKWIEKFYKDCLQGKVQEVENAIHQATIKKQSLGNMKIPAPVCQTVDSDEDEDDDGDAMDYDGDEIPKLV